MTNTDRKIHKLEVIADLCKSDIYTLTTHTDIKGGSERLKRVRSNLQKTQAKLEALRRMSHA